MKRCPPAPRSALCWGIIGKKVQRFCFENRLQSMEGYDG
jgi:hypothetical protein